MSEAKEESLDDIDENATIKLKSKEGTLIEISKKAAFQSKFIKTALEHDKDAAEVQLQHIETAILQKVVDYLVHHLNNPAKNIPKPLTTSNLTEVVDAWDAKFADMENNQDNMFKVLLAANYMDIGPLLNLMCAKVATLMRGKTPEEIRRVFNIRSDYTPEEEEQVRKEHKDLLE